MPISEAIGPGQCVSSGRRGFSGFCYDGKMAPNAAAMKSSLQPRMNLGLYGRIGRHFSPSVGTLYSVGCPLALPSNLNCKPSQLQVHPRKRIVKKVGDYNGGLQIGHVGWGTSKGLEWKQKGCTMAMVSSSSGSPEELSLGEIVVKNPMWGFLEGAREAFSSDTSPPKDDNLEKELGRLVLPALVGRTVEPMAQLLESACIGTFMGPVELASVGIGNSIFNLLSKMFNFPLVNVTTSFVAEEDASARASILKSSVVQPGIDTRGESLPHSKPQLPSVSSALVIAAAIGILEAGIMAFGARPVLTMMGVGVASPMHKPAAQYLSLRAIGAPAVVTVLAVQSIFRGFKDTKTPLNATILGSTVNIILSPIFMFSLKLGVTGAGLATVISQYLIAIVMLWNLSGRVTLLPPRIWDLPFDRFLKSGGLLLGRTVALMFTMTLSTSMAARQGPIPMAAHQVCFQIWVASSLLIDSLALAGQAVIASAFAKGDFRMVKEATFRTLQIGLAIGLIFSLVLGLGAVPFSHLFTKDAGVLAQMALIIPFLVVMQPINSLAFVFDGIHYGVSDFGYAAVSMMAIAVPSCVTLLWATSVYAVQGTWIGLTTIMALRMLVGILRIGSCTGPWAFLRNSQERLKDSPAM